MQPRAGIAASIIVPAFNAERFIARAVNSALQQTERCCEVVVIDDASSDNTAGIVADIATQDRRVCLLRNPVNLGPAASRNRGLSAARGEWIALLDADDEFALHRIETLISLGERSDADIVADNLLLCPEDAPDEGEPMLAANALPGQQWMSAAEFVIGNIGSRHTPRISHGFMQPVIRRSFLTAHDIRYNEDSRFAEDFMFYLNCLLQGARWWLTPEAMYRYTIRQGSLTEVQTAPDLLRIRSFEQQLLRNHPAVRSDRELRRALHRHKAKIDRFYFYRAFTDAVKAGHPVRASKVLLSDINSIRHIFLESLTQAPRLTRKVLHLSSTRTDERQQGRCSQRSTASPASSGKGATGLADASS
jgi:glycosyltransferase involved in cell wall biosynthesis